MRNDVTPQKQVARRRCPVAQGTLWGEDAPAAPRPRSYGPPKAKPQAKPRMAEPSRVDPPPGLERQGEAARAEKARNIESGSQCVQALADGLPIGPRLKPRPYMALKDSSHVTTHKQQLQAYTAYEQLLQDLPSQLDDPERLLHIANQLLYLPDTFPASYLQIYNPMLPPPV